MSVSRQLEAPKRKNTDNAGTSRGDWHRGFSVRESTLSNQHDQRMRSRKDGRPMSCHGSCKLQGGVGGAFSEELRRMCGGCMSPTPTPNPQPEMDSRAFRITHLDLHHLFSTSLLSCAPASFIDTTLLPFLFIF